MMAYKHVVGIFSQDTRDEFDWLIPFLLTIPGVNDVRTIHITNTNYMEVMDEAYKCTFAILYHSMKRGRINVADVTDALYDKELDDLSRCLGRDGVIVVIDDVEDSCLEAKNNILQKQPSIGRLTIELYLFGDQDKNYQGEASNFTGNKLVHMKRLISGKINKDHRPETSVNNYVQYPADRRISLQRINEKHACIVLFGICIIVIIILGVTLERRGVERRGERYSNTLTRKH
ncbi:uncharacterized protein LOC121399008 isoform X2 [Xenopus laevis]|uniref:Uncharacterized protein LOC121399008 isoform X2 n=1 Tax=Xenopus laevis TaxID=8355 RepID=A0A8J1LYW4_XENLA|nr:uncharacterized protein LOC121399008 isoform X2 [Xenopus laevis]